jgi:demethylmenaquinone methyltransferase / 2-methoxy-6-polyprenyl-1,4-benzoquinol methylase
MCGGGEAARLRQMAPPASIPAAPHPVLARYYTDAEGKRPFVRGIFDRTACDYDRIERIMGLGSGSWYRHQALLRAGLAPGMKVLDVAIGTGLTAREAQRVVGARGSIVGLDPSMGMISRAVAALRIPAAIGVAEQIPLADECMDFLSLGFALRHVNSIEIAFREFHRVLRPGGRLCILEITRPRGVLARTALRAYLRLFGVWLTRLVARRTESAALVEYYWQTIDACLPPQRICEALWRAGFVDVARREEFGIFSEYTARKSG